jgi:nicotinamide mononucleotide (NMN) deamidase PncC
MQKNDLIEEIQASGYQSVWVVTGGGIGAVHCMLAHPGASRFVKDIRIPYSPEALEDFLGEPPESACSEKTARLMAAKALEKSTMGIACTAALQTNRTRKGADRAFICIQSQKKTACKCIDLDPGTRSEQDAFVSGMLLALIAEFVRQPE